MIRRFVPAVVAAAIGLGTAFQAVAADPPRPWCARHDTNCDGRVDWRDRYYDPPLSRTAVHLRRRRHVLLPDAARPDYGLQAAGQGPLLR
jgi:hypothetical protein